MKQLTKLINNQGKFYKRLSRAVEDRRKNWNPFHDRCKAFFNQVIEETRKAPFFDSLHIDDGKDRFSERKNLNTITIYFGQHPTGIEQIEYKENGDFKSGSLIVEKGGKLHYAQHSNGQVISIIYGCKSELLKTKDEWFVFKRYNNPKEITEKEMMKALKAFFWYNRITSHLTGFTIFDTYRLDFYKLKSFSSKPDWNMVFGVIGAIAALATIVAFIL